MENGEEIIVKLYNSEGFHIVEPDGGDGLKLIPVTAFSARDDEDRTVEAIAQPSDGFFITTPCAWPLGKLQVMH
jgi:hypothetical protein